MTGLAQSWSIALVGLDGHAVEVEADIAQGLPKTTLIGLPDAALSEARDRVRAAIAQDPVVGGRLALWGRRLVGEALNRDEALALQGSGFDFTNDDVESFSDPSASPRGES